MEHSVATHSVAGGYGMDEDQSVAAAGFDLKSYMLQELGKGKNTHAKY